MTKKKNAWYAWRDDEGNGGVCQTWDECQHASSGRRGEKHKGFQRYEEAWAFACPRKPIPASSEIQPKDDREKGLFTNNFKSLIAESDPIPVESLTLLKQDKKPLAPLDMSRAEKGPVSDQVNRFCNLYRFTQLSIDQRRAVQSTKGKYLLFAVPGSGKTTVILARTGYLIHSCGIDPKKLMTMTFTRAAAKEMHDRYCELFCKSTAEEAEQSVPDFRTIHSFCFSVVIPLLRKKGFKCPGHVINEDLKDKSLKKKRFTQRVILKSILKEFVKADKASDETVQDAFQTAFSSIKNREMQYEEYCSYSVKIDKIEYPLAPVYEKYQQSLRELDCMDFDDMLIYALRGLREKPVVLKELQERYEYWSVDEAQDNSKIQHELLQLLSGPGGNLFMVGDDDQSIYSFRGAEPSLLLDYGRQPDVHLLLMGTNFRSDLDIVTTAKQFVESNTSRADKQMNASHTDRGTISVSPGFKTEAMQYAYIESMAKACEKNGSKLGVLYQLNISALPLIVRMHKTGIPFESSRGLADLLRWKIVGNIIQILRFVISPNNIDRFLECKKSLGLYWVDEEKTNELKQAHSKNKQKSVLLTLLEIQVEESIRTEQLRLIISDLKEISELSPAEATWKIEKSFIQLSFETLTERLSFYAFLSICDLYSSIKEMLIDLAGMIQAEKEKALGADEDSDEPEIEEQEVTTEGKPVVTLSTIHSAKGRQWDHVIIIDSFDETFPGNPQPDRIGYDPEEPRRLFYVAVTRAIHRLDILTVEYWHGNIECVSPFVTHYAWIADQNTEKPVSEGIYIEENKIDSSDHKLTPTVYYGVPVGRVPGVYISYNEAQGQVHGFSVPPEKQLKKFTSYEEAWEYTFPAVPFPVAGNQIVKDSIKSFIQMSGGVVFNKPIDLPSEVKEGILSYLGITSLMDLSRERIALLKEQSNLFGKGIQADYHGHTDGYTTVYLPVNFYKIWLPLWKLLDNNMLPLKADILELGPGPGTSTWSLIDLYKRLAIDNPYVSFELHYTAVELEKDFDEVFNSIRKKVEKTLPLNLALKLSLLSEKNAFDYIDSLDKNSIDLIVESNLLNEEEKRTDDNIPTLLSGIYKVLRKGGYFILIEPGTTSQMEYMHKLMKDVKGYAEYMPYEAVNKACVYLADNSLVQQAVNLGLRISKKMEHWFSYMIIERTKV